MEQGGRARWVLGVGFFGAGRSVLSSPMAWPVSDSSGHMGQRRVP